MKKQKLTAILCILLCAVFTANTFCGCTPKEITADAETTIHENTMPTLPYSDTVAHNEDFLLEPAVYPAIPEYPEDDSDKDALAQWENYRETLMNSREIGKNLKPFSESIISQLLKSENENAVCSPFNIYFALAMLAECADTDTREEILDLLCAENIESLRAQAEKLFISNYTDEELADVKPAASLWLDDSFTFNQNTLDILKNSYYASSFQGKMGSNDYTKAMQSWLNEQTGNLLSDYVDDIAPTEDIAMSILTSLYLKAQWLSPFSEENTTEEIFHSPTGDVTCEFMNKTLSNETLYMGESFSAVSCPLYDCGSMVLILPDEGVTTSCLLESEEALSFMTGNIHDWENKTILKIHLSLPKFDVSSSQKVGEALKDLGITQCFDPDTADFSPLLGEQEAFVSDINHCARVMIDEEGASGAAYTEVLLFGESAARPQGEEIVFNLNRPFIFVITGSEGLPLFAGVVNEP